MVCINREMCCTNDLYQSFWLVWLKIYKSNLVRTRILNDSYEQNLFLAAKEYFVQRKMVYEVDIRFLCPKAVHETACIIQIWLVQVNLGLYKYEHGLCKSILICRNTRMACTTKKNAYTDTLYCTDNKWFAQIDFCLYHWMAGVVRISMDWCRLVLPSSHPQPHPHHAFHPYS